MFSSGTCGCLDFDLTQGDDYIVILHNVLFATQLLKDFDTNTQRMVVDRICNTPVALGDHDQVQSERLFNQHFISCFKLALDR